MCLPCLLVDHMLTFDPPWGLESASQPPVPLPHAPWSLERLRAYYELLVRVQEESVPCLPTTAYLERFGARLAALEQQATALASEQQS